MKNTSKNLTALFDEAKKALNDAHMEIQSIALDDISDLNDMHLLLQYRLDAQDALQQLFQLQQSLWQCLGISNAETPSHNLERIAFALGHDDLHLLMSMLNQLVSALLKLLQLQENHSHPQHSHHRDKKIIKALSHQRHFKTFITSIEHKIRKSGSALISQQEVLQGALSEIYQSLQTGLVASGSLIQRSVSHLNVKPELKEVIQQIQQLTHQLKQPEPSRLFKPEKPLNPETLEKRAENKRLGHFFRAH